MRHNPDHIARNALPQSPRFELAARSLVGAGVWQALAAASVLDSALVGTIPLGVDLPESDLDIVCERPADRDVDEFTDALRVALSEIIPAGMAAGSVKTAEALRIWQRPGAIDGQPAVVAQFEIPAAPPEINSGGNHSNERPMQAPSDSTLLVEIFTDVLPVADQMAGRHYRVEYELLQQARRDGRLIAAQTEIRRLKRGGLSTERAFCEYFAIEIAEGSDEFRTLYEYAPKTR